MSESQETYTLLPVEQCAIHPLARIRFDYEVDELAESIRSIGQVQPGKAVEQTDHARGQESRYLVYIGCRRLVACKKTSLKHFKAIVVKSIEESRLQRELLTENVKRANLSVLEELNLLGNYSKRLYSLDDLARDLGLSPRLVRERVKLAILIQDKSLIETLYKAERISGFRFTYRNIEKITAFDEEKWLPLAIHAAERNWKAEDVEALGERFPLASLMETLPAWGRQFIPAIDQEPAVASEVKESEVEGVHIPPNRSEETSSGLAEPNGGRQEEPQGEEEEGEVDSPSRYQTISKDAQFLICPKCGCESAIEFPRYPSATLFRPGNAENGRNAISLAKESISLQMAVALVTCANVGCGRTLILALDESGEGTPTLVGRNELLTLMGRGVEPKNAGTGALVWDEKRQIWLKAQARGEDSVYHGYDEQSKRWNIPVKLGTLSARVIR